MIIWCSSTPNEYKKTETFIKELKLENIKMLPKTNNIFEMSSYIKYSDMIVSVDTSIIHIASSYNKSILGIYQNNDEIIEYAKPKSKNYQIVKSVHKKVIKDLNINEIKNKFILLYMGEKYEKNIDKNS